MVNSKAKGARGEREFAHYLKEEAGTEARRGCQFSGSPDSPDVVSDDAYHWEVKRTERLKIYEAIDQAVRDSAGGAKIPAVAFRSNKKEWLVILRAKDFFKI